MSKFEKRALAILGAIGTGLVGVGASLTGVAIADNQSTIVQTVTLLSTGIGGLLLTGSLYYKNAVTDTSV